MTTPSRRCRVHKVVLVESLVGVLGCRLCRREAAREHVGRGHVRALQLGTLPAAPPLDAEGHTGAEWIARPARA